MQALTPETARFFPEPQRAGSLVRLGGNGLRVMFKFMRSLIATVGLSACGQSPERANRSMPEARAALRDFLNSQESVCVSEKAGAARDKEGFWDRLRLEARAWRSGSERKILPIVWSEWHRRC